MTASAVLAGGQLPEVRSRPVARPGGLGSPRRRWQRGHPAAAAGLAAAAAAPWRRPVPAGGPPGQRDAAPLGIRVLRQGDDTDTTICSGLGLGLGQGSGRPGQNPHPTQTLVLVLSHSPREVTVTLGQGFQHLGLPLCRSCAVSLGASHSGFTQSVCTMCASSIEHILLIVSCRLCRQYKSAVSSGSALKLLASCSLFSQVIFERNVLHAAAWLFAGCRKPRTARGVARQHGGRKLGSVGGHASCSAPATGTALTACGQRLSASRNECTSFCHVRIFQLCACAVLPVLA